MSNGSYFISLFVLLTCVNNVTNVFRGSPEIFSGYLPNFKLYAESFSYTKGLEIVGTSTQVEKMLAEENPQSIYT